MRAERRLRPRIDVDPHPDEYPGQTQEGLTRGKLEGSRFGSRPGDPAIFVLARVWHQIS